MGIRVVRPAALIVVAAVVSMAPAVSDARPAEDVAGAAPTDHPYVALGDSVSLGFGASTPEKGFVGLLFAEYQPSLGANLLLNEAVPGESASSLRNGGQLTAALADINADSDTRAVTIETGGADALLANTCPGHWDEPAVCSFRADFSFILGRLKAALAADPGAETFTAMAYPNPSTGTGTAQEMDRERALLGDDLALGCTDAGSAVGLNDAIFQEADKLGVPVADTYPAFHEHGQAYISDGLHPNDAGYAAIAQSFGEAGSCAEVTDTKAPRTRITSGPAKRTHDRTPKFSFRSSEAGSSFACSLDDGSYRPCSSPHVTKRLARGRHVFRVKAQDAAGNTDRTAARAAFKIIKR